MNKTKKFFMNKKTIIFSFLFLAVKAAFFFSFDTAGGAKDVILQLLALLAEQAAFLAIYLLLAGEKKSDLLYLLMLLNPFSAAWFGVGFLAQLVLMLVFLVLELKVKQKIVLSVAALLISFLVVLIDNSAFFSVVVFILLLIVANRKIKQSLPELLGMAIGIIAASILYNRVSVWREFWNHINNSTEAGEISFLFRLKQTPQETHVACIVAAAAAVGFTLLLLTVAINSQKKMARRYAQSGQKRKNGLTEQHADKTLALIFIPSIMALIGACLDQTAACALLGITPVMILLLLAREEDVFSLSLIHFLEYFWEKRLLLSCFCLAGYSAASLLLYTTDVLYAGAVYLVP